MPARGCGVDASVGVVGTPRSEFAGGVSAASLARGRTSRGHGADNVPGVEDGFPVEVFPGTTVRCAGDGLSVRP